MKLNKGQKTDLTKISNTRNFVIGLGWSAAPEIDLDGAAFLLGDNGKVDADDDLVFYGNPKHKSGAVTHGGDNASNNARDVEQIHIDLERVPASVKRIAFTATIYDAEQRRQNFGQVRNVFIRVAPEVGGNDLITFELDNALSVETALVVAEIYRHKGEWKFNAVGAGFSGGLAALCNNFGIDVTDEATPVEQNAHVDKPANKKISLEKKISEGAPKLISLVKPLKVELKKRNLEDVTARVALVMDISGSMSNSYANGTVQMIVNKILPLAVQFDDDGELDFWYFGDRAQRQPTVDMHNYEGAVPRDWRRLMSSLGGGTNEPCVIREVINEYEHSQLPVYVIFISDGCVGYESEIKKLLKYASTLPIFWQFVGVGGSNYGVLERLDDMEGRYVDNADFFALDDFRTVSNEDLYSRLLTEFPHWLEAIKRKGLPTNVTPQSSPTPSLGQRITNFFFR